MKKCSRAELLAPAGSFESVRAAVNAGADAVYMGGTRFGARAYSESAESEDEDMVMEAIRWCHLFGVKLYMTVNILFKESELKEFFSYIKPYYEAGLDGVIVQDFGAVELFHRYFPGLPVHASTQMSITNRNGALLVKRLGMTRAVLARELSLPEIRSVHEACGPDFELEIFIHGAMCYSYSGSCFMSSFLGGRSGNRGRCAGPCRLCYEAYGEKGYFLSMKDMETLSMLPELLDAGAFSLKIEGRMKSPVYTAGVVSVYRSFLDSALKGEKRTVTEADRQILREIFDRGSTSYLDRHNGADMIVARERDFRAADEKRREKIRKNYLENDRTRKIRLFFQAHVGEKALLRATLDPSDGEEAGFSAFSEKMLQPSEKKPLSESEIREKLLSVGSSPFSVSELTMDYDGSAFLPLSVLKSLRRSAFSGLEEEILKPFERTLS